MSVWSMINGHTTPIFVKNSHERPFSIIPKANTYEFLTKKWFPPEIQECNLWCDLWQGNICGVRCMSVWSMINGHTTPIFVENSHCWGPSAYEGPQKQDLTVFLEFNVWTGIFGLKSVSQQTRIIRRLIQRRRCEQESFGVIATKWNRLKDEKAIRTSMDYYRVIVRCKGHKCNFVRAVSRVYK